MIKKETYDFPPTYKLIIRRLLPSGKLKILDLGCGFGAAGQVLNYNRVHEFTGIDIYKPYLKVCRKGKYYKKIINADITKLKLKKNSFDVILLLQVIEHLDKSIGERLLRQAIKAAKRCVIVSVPNGHCSQEEYDGNIHQKHLSVWTVPDLKKINFKVYGQSLSIIYGSKSYERSKKASLWQKIIVPLSIFIFPVILFFPQLGAQLIAVKYND